MPSKSSSNNDSVGENSSGAPVSKDKKFKRIRGLLGGESRKEKKERKARDKKKKHDGDDDATYQVNVEERSIATAPPKRDEAHGGKKSSYMLKVVLLLMDPKSRRFELLQLEFDSLKALVSDVMAQIPVSVTEEVLRKQTYLGICGHDGKEMPLNVLLSQFCKGNDVLVAVPQGVPAKECARLALPILTDEKVVNMLQTSGINVSEWIDSKNKKNQRSTKAPSARKSILNGEDDSQAGSGKTVTLILVVLAAIFLQVFHLYISAPIKPGHIVSPNLRLSKCGILSFMPTCSNAYMSFENEGTIVLKDANNNLLWQIKGGVCRKGDKNCIRGMKVGEDGELVVGGRLVTTVQAFKDDVQLSPWPFAEKPKIHVRRESTDVPSST